MSEQEQPKIVVDGEQYVIDDLSQEIKDLLGLHQEATQMMIASRRQAAIHELAVQNLGNMISAKVKEEPVEAEIVPDEPEAA